MTKFFVGQEGVKTRDGRDVRILCVDGPGNYPIIALIGLDLMRYQADGLLSPYIGDWHWTLILPKHTIWVNVYEDRVSKHSTAGIAISCAGHDCLKVAHPITIEVEV